MRRIKFIIGVIIFIVLLSIAGRIYNNWQNEILYYEWEDVLEETYELEVIEEYGSFEVPYEDSMDLNLPGYTFGMFWRFLFTPFKERPEQGVLVNYILTNDGEKIVYSYPYIYRKQKPKDHVFVIDPPHVLSLENIVFESEEWNAYASIKEDIEARKFTMTHSYDTKMSIYFEGFDSFMEKHMFDVLFFELTEQEVVFFFYHEDMYVVIRQDDHYVFVIPEVMTFDQFKVSILSSI